MFRSGDCFAQSAAAASASMPFISSFDPRGRNGAMPVTPTSPSTVHSRPSAISVLGDRSVPAGRWANGNFKQLTDTYLLFLALSLFGFDQINTNGKKKVPRGVEVYHLATLVNRFRKFERPTPSSSSLSSSTPYKYRSSTLERPNGDSRDRTDQI